VYGDDVGMIETGSRPCLAQEALAQRRVFEDLRLRHLEGDLTAEARVIGQPDDAVRSLTELATQLEPIQIARAGRRLARRRGGGVTGQHLPEQPHTGQVPLQARL